MNRPVPPTTTTGAPLPPVTAAGETVPPTTTGTTPPPPPDDPEAIRREIDRTRGDMEGTIDAINDRVNPQRIRDRKTYRLRQRWWSLRSSVMGGGGDDSPSFRDRTPDVGARAGQARESMGDRASDARETVGARAGDARETIGERADQARQAVSDAPQKMQRQTRGNPLTAGVIAFGVGTLIGSALPDSEAERRAARAAADHVDVEGAKQRLTDHAREVQSGVQDKAREAAEDLKGSARDAAQDVKGQAQQEGQRVKDDAKQSGQEVRRQT